MTPTETMALVEEFGRRMLHIGSQPGSAHLVRTGDEEREANAVLDTIRRSLETPDPFDSIVTVEGADLAGFLRQLADPADISKVSVVIDEGVKLKINDHGQWSRPFGFMAK